MNIIIVDDERVIRQGLRRIIELLEIDHTITGEASDGQEAYGLLLKEPCDLLITDIRMPIMDGLELIKAIRSTNQSMEIVILSGFGEFTYAQEAIQLKVMGYILKPMNPSLVQEILEAANQRLLDRKRRFSSHSQFFNRCTALVDKLVEACWQLDTQQIQLGMEQIEAEVDALALDEIETDQVYREFISWIVTKLELKTSTNIEFRKAAKMESTENNKDMKQRFSYAAQCITDEIRLTRNWGKYDPIREAIGYIQTNYANSELSLQEMLQMTGLSATYFYELFKAETGHSFKSFLVNLRIEQAKLLLHTSEYKTYEVGEKVGYQDYPHFSKLFKKLVGVSPSEYKKQTHGEM
ncbi:response regulator [Paenibacillus sp. UMB7766-LJ446]|uniref:response regulator n=1 Tax=Paenibacillus sp. UMB7766-LJ446 TaxID=3046313 RepID=UPI00254C34F7|nr:response regulator [Paenibacillus sp. UMB7766-LJ446]MDK8189901.1 response regulator [Paenibacillus sp. UMB7766-LJ446]